MLFQLLAIALMLAAVIASYMASLVKADPGLLLAPHDVIYMNTVMTFANTQSAEKVGRLTAIASWLGLAGVGCQVLALMYGH